jgi:hypothetical protein
VTSAAAGGKLVIPFRVPRTSNNYQVYIWARTPPGPRADGILTIKDDNGTQLDSFKWLFKPDPSGKYLLRQLLKVWPTPVKFSLQAGKTYELTIAARPKAVFPAIDMIVISDGSQAPLPREFCR